MWNFLLLSLVCTVKHTRVTHSRKVSLENRCEGGFSDLWRIHLQQCRVEIGWNSTKERTLWIPSQHNPHPTRPPFYPFSLRRREMVKESNSEYVKGREGKSRTPRAFRREQGFHRPADRKSRLTALLNMILYWRNDNDKGRITFSEGYIAELT